MNGAMTKLYTKTIESLEREIAAGRKKLQEAYDARGCTDSVVLAYSIELDKLIVRYHKLTTIHRTRPRFSGFAGMNHDSQDFQES